ncbi:hypothetical protein [Thalassomonas haliotis]|uniref:Uncharacterized protein n=1 Tax=Thalassomonas haliotis TaxID=485448 RepID=A0ABY7VM56_9GAMM|nr:hypothetical protein [Thalassomonas haliotis]WDE13737.1 hypothetical protein H3N35_10035 [Thalassomonas haliotis]
MQTSTSIFFNKYMKGIALIPIHLMLALLIAKLPIVIWLVAIIAILVITDKLYNLAFSREDSSHKEKSLIYVGIIASQFGLIILIFSIQ